MFRPNRNDPCPCGSGKQFKRCCLGKSPYNRLKAAPKHAPSRSADISLKSRPVSVPGVFMSLDEILISIKSEGFIDAVFEKHLDDVFGLSFITADLYCGHNYNSETRTYWNRPDGLFEHVESSYDAEPCPLCTFEFPVDPVP